MAFCSSLPVPVTFVVEAEPKRDVTSDAQPLRARGDCNKDVERDRPGMRAQCHCPALMYFCDASVLLRQYFPRGCFLIAKNPT